MGEQELEALVERVRQIPKPKRFSIAVDSLAEFRKVLELRCGPMKHDPKLPPIGAQFMGLKVEERRVLPAGAFSIIEDGQPVYFGRYRALAAKEARISELDHIANHWLAEHDKLRAELEQVKRERDDTKQALRNEIVAHGNTIRGKGERPSPTGAAE